MITDSIGKALPSNRLWSHHALIGKTFKDATERMISGDIRVGGLRVIAFHLGTNSMDYRGWGRMSSWQERLAAMQEEVKALYRSVRRYNATCFIVFSAVLPRGCDWQHTQELYMAFNRFLRQFAREKRCGYLPTFTSFIYKDGPKKGRPIEGLFAIRDGGLHLNLVGRQVFTDRFKMALSPRQLYSMAVAAGFKYWGGIC